jgi:acyl carrier protein
MNAEERELLRKFLAERLESAGHREKVTDDASIFVSGILDSLNMLMLIAKLEETFGIDFGRIDFDISLIDSINDINTLVSSWRNLA